MLGLTQRYMCVHTQTPTLPLLLAASHSHTDVGERESQTGCSILRSDFQFTEYVRTCPSILHSCPLMRFKCCSRQKIAFAQKTLEATTRACYKMWLVLVIGNDSPQWNYSLCGAVLCGRSVTLELCLLLFLLLEPWFRMKDNPPSRRYRSLRHVFSLPYRRFPLQTRVFLFPYFTGDGFTQVLSNQ